MAALRMHSIIATWVATTAWSAQSAQSAASQRTTVPFQYAWRFHFGDDPSSPPESGPGTMHFDTDLANYSKCQGMEHAPNRFSMKDCRLACAYDPHCLVWQAFPIEHGRSCFQVLNRTATEGQVLNRTATEGQV